MYYYGNGLSYILICTLLMSINVHHQSISSSKVVNPYIADTIIIIGSDVRINSLRGGDRSISFPFL